MQGMWSVGGQDHSHVMVVPVGRGRMFFHAGCWRVRAVRELAADGPKVRVWKSRRFSFGKHAALSCLGHLWERELRGES